MSSSAPIRPRTDTSEAGLRAAVQDDLELNATRRRAISGERFVRTPALVAYACDLASVDVNEVVRARFPDGEAADAAIDDAVALVGRPFLWWVSDEDTPADLGQRLERRGFLFLDDIPGMAMDLADLAGPDAAPSPAELTIAPILDPAGVDAFHAVLAHGFPEDFVDAATEAAISAASRQRAAETNYREPDGLPTRWLGTVDGRPVAILRADYLDQGVAVTAGDHVIELRYDDLMKRA